MCNLLSSSMSCKPGMTVQLQDLTFWQGKLGVQRAPSVVFLRGPGALPAVYDASNTKRLDIAKLIADNAWQVTRCMYVCDMLLEVTHMTSPSLGHIVSSISSKATRCHGSYIAHACCLDVAVACCIHVLMLTHGSAQDCLMHSCNTWFQMSSFATNAKHTLFTDTLSLM